MYNSYWGILEKTIEWLDSVEDSLGNCNSCRSLEILEAECGRLISIVLYLTGNPPFMLKVLQRSDFKKVSKYLGDRVKGLTVAFNKKRIYLHVKKIV